MKRPAPPEGDWPDLVVESPVDADVQVDPPPAGPVTSGFGLADLALIFQSSLWAANYTVVKAVTATMQPLAFNGARMAVATLLFVLIALATRASLRLPRRDLPRMALLGLLGHALFQTCFALGIVRTTAASAGLLLATSPLFVALLAVLRGEERLLPRAWLGVLGSIAGVAVLVLSSGGALGLGGEQLIGDLCFVAAALLWALYTVLSRPMLGRYSSLQVNTLTLLLGVPLLLLVAAPQLASERWAELPPGAWLGFGYASVLAIVVAYLIYSFGVQRLGASRTAAYYNTTPPLAALIAWLFGGEPLSALFLLGAALILGGLYLVRTGTR